LEAAWEIQWIWNFLEKLGIMNELPTLVYEANQATIAYASNHHNLRCMKHIYVKYHYICHFIEAKIIKLQYMSSDEMTADILTKPLPLATHLYHMVWLGVIFNDKARLYPEAKLIKVNENYTLFLDRNLVRKIFSKQIQTEISSLPPVPSTSPCLVRRKMVRFTTSSWFHIPMPVECSLKAPRIIVQELC
jgi:hypothetical protein